MEKKITAISFENLKDDMIHIRLFAAWELRKCYVDRGSIPVRLITVKECCCGISGIAPTKVIIIGAGIIGEYAVRAALALELQ